MVEPVIGIDLGTTNSEVSFAFDDAVKIIESNDIENTDKGILPSCVGIDNKGRVIVGEKARNQAAAFPENTILAVKRQMGENLHFILGNQGYSPQEISSLILKELKTRAEQAIGQKVNKAVITVPAYFTDAQRQATKEAGTIAGLNVLRIINEPTAAALAYEELNSADQKNILVYDLGGGTFDVSIVKIENKIVEVLASTGDNRLGGDDFDSLIVQFLVQQIKDTFGKDVANEKTIMARLKNSAERAKIQLSTLPFADIQEDHLAEGLHLSYELSRTQFEEMIKEYLEKTIMSVTTALADARLTPEDIDKILLVGGSTRIPMVSELLKEKLGIEPSLGVDPDLCVALGAGIQAGREMGKDIASMLIDITPYTFGTAAWGEVDGEYMNDCFVPLIKKNTKLPASRTEAFQTMMDNQEAALLKVFQGENKNALDNIFINSYSFDLSRAPAGSVITLRYDLDLNGILKLEAVEKDTGKKINAVLENVFSNTSEAQMRESMDKINTLFNDGRQDDKTCDNGIQKEAPPVFVMETLALAQEKLSIAPEEDKDEIINLMEDIKGLNAQKEFAKALELSQELEDILFYIE